MKSFKLFLVEDGNKTLIQDKGTFISEVQDKCSEFITNSSITHQLYRGMKYPSNVKMGFSKIRSDREPTDTDRDIHKVLDDFFFDEFKIRYRSNAVFATPDKSKAEKYGKSFHIFPTNGYSMVGSKLVLDLYTETTTKTGLAFFTNTTARDLLKPDDFKTYSNMKYNWSKFEIQEIKDFNRKIFDKFEYFESKKVKDFGKHEVMISANSYYFLLFEEKGWETSDEIINGIYYK